MPDLFDQIIAKDENVQVSHQEINPCKQWTFYHRMIHEFRKLADLFTLFRPLSTYSDVLRHECLKVKNEAIHNDDHKEGSKN